MQQGTGTMRHLHWTTRGEPGIVPRPYGTGLPLRQDLPQRTDPPAARRWFWSQWLAICRNSGGGMTDLSVAQILADLETQIAQVESQEAFHAQQEALHR